MNFAFFKSGVHYFVEFYKLRPPNWACYTNKLNTADHTGTMTLIFYQSKYNAVKQYKNNENLTIEWLSLEISISQGNRLIWSAPWPQCFSVMDKSHLRRHSQIPLLQKFKFSTQFFPNCQTGKSQLKHTF